MRETCICDNAMFFITIKEIQTVYTSLFSFIQCFCQQMFKCNCIITIIRVIKAKNPLIKIYCVLIGGMLCGRITYGILNALIFKAGAYSLQAWLSAAFITALPGIIIQLIVIPLLVLGLSKAKLIRI